MCQPVGFPLVELKFLISTWHPVHTWEVIYPQFLWGGSNTGLSYTTVDPSLRVVPMFHSFSHLHQHKVEWMNKESIVISLKIRRVLETLLFFILIVTMFNVKENRMWENHYQISTLWLMGWPLCFFVCPQSLYCVLLHIFLYIQF